MRTRADWDRLCRTLRNRARAATKRARIVRLAVDVATRTSARSGEQVERSLGAIDRTRTRLALKPGSI
jgi:hypothetical protein